MTDIFCSSLASKGIPALGIEPAANVARLAEEKGVPTRVAFFGEETARSLVAEGLAADLTVANNVLAHVPDLTIFVGGFADHSKKAGCCHLRIPTSGQPDSAKPNSTPSITSTLATSHCLPHGPFFARHSLRVFDVEKLPTHGGSLRLYVCRETQAMRPARRSTH